VARRQQRWKARKCALLEGLRRGYIFFSQAFPSQISSTCEALMARIVQVFTNIANIQVIVVGRAKATA